ncbi:MAG: polysaccharide biosynthesis protein [Vallitaleaceae bacterium]|nr:polysaccharide biosynthesis protein [Vallitaleaceae bacterium]
MYSDNRLLNAVLLLLSASVKLGLTYVLTLFIGNIILAIFIAQAATDLAVGIIAISKSHLKPSIKIKAYSKNMLKQLIAYGYPLIGMGLIMTLLNMSDRYIIKFFYDNNEVGLYTSNYSLASAAFTMLMVGLSRGSYPKILEAWHKKDYSTAERTLSAGGKYFMMFGLPAATGLLLLSKPIASLCLGADYFEGYPVIGIVAFAMLFCGLSEYKNKGWELKAQTLPILLNSLIAAFVNILLNILFIPIFGYIFAAYSTLIAFFIYFLVSSIRENKTIRFRIPKKNSWNILISCAIMSIIVLMFDYFFLIDLKNLMIVIVLAMLSYFMSLYFLGEIKNEVKNLL